MQALRGTKDILPHEIIVWQHIYQTANEILTLYNYNEIRTPIIENTELFYSSIGNFTDIVNKEMYNFTDQGKRNITLRPEGTASIARAFISNQLNVKKQVNKLWYLGPMFRYERPQKGRQRQFHQLGLECIGSSQPVSDVEVIRLAVKILQKLQCPEHILEINSIGSLEERNKYKIKLVNYLNKYSKDLDIDSQHRLKTNPLRILDSKNIKTQEIIQDGPKIRDYLTLTSKKHFNEVCEHLNYLNIHYKINENLVRGLDYYNYTAFEIKTKQIHQQNTICGGGRYDKLIKQLGGPHVPSVGWAIGIERLIITIKDRLKVKNNKNIIYIVTQTKRINYYIWDIIKILEKYNIKFELDLITNNLSKQLKRAQLSQTKICIIIGEEEIKNQYITIKWLTTGTQQKIQIRQLPSYCLYLRNNIKT
uniref:Histidine--tRNA ligase, chloroplastic n=1 Tax=Dasyclonium flaccidum TaxID=2007274 RepID=A0A1Z1MLJ1_9FLOR|nr:Histidine-tRNA ligase [Dasyclonium flaccidum]ARW66722.1 Histidine-tRNA ligase [Dasyclonium flaccidum]